MQMLSHAGFVDVRVGPPLDVVAGASGEANARAFDVSGYVFLARRPGRES
jgi:hypothetical protein